MRRSLSPRSATRRSTPAQTQRAQVGGLRVGDDGDLAGRALIRIQRIERHHALLGHGGLQGLQPGLGGQIAGRADEREWWQ
jgi:hypothetical protein